MKTSQMNITGILGAASCDPLQLERVRRSIDKLVEYGTGPSCLISGNEYIVYVNGCKTVLGGMENDESQTFIVGTHYSSGNKHYEVGHFLVFQPKGRQGFSFRTDPVGLINLYRYSDRGVTIFGTSSMQVAALVPHLEHDSIGMQEFLVAGYLFSSRTYYKGIDVVPGGIDWIVEPGEDIKGVEKAWYGHPNLKVYDERGSINELIQATRKAASNIAADGHACCDLTGGYDSRGVASMFLAAGLPFSTVVNGSPALPDVRIAQAISTKFGFDHYHNDTSSFLPPQDYRDIARTIVLTDGEIDVPEYYNTELIHRITAGKGWLTVNGSGGELFRGYWWEGEWPDEGTKRQVEVDYLVKRIMLPHLDFSFFRIAESDIKNYVRQVVKNVTDAVGHDEPSGRRIDMLYLKVRMGRWFARFYSSTQKILPCHSPFLTKPVLDIALGIQPVEKKRVRFYRKWLFANHRQLAIIPLENLAPAIPCTWTSAWHFRHYPAYILRKVLDRLQRKFLPNQAGRLALSQLEDAFLSIGSRESGSCCFMPPVKDLLSNGAAEKFERLLGGEDQHIQISQFSRVFTLDLTLREVGKLRSMLDAECR